MKLFLQGSFEVGKTTLIHDVLRQSGVNATGFQSVKLFDDAKENAGFCVMKYTNNMPLALHVDDERVFQNQVFMRGRASKRVLYKEVFSRLCEIVGDYTQYDCFVMDEIGGLELFVPEAKEYIFKVFQSGIPCLGSIKSSENLKHMQDKTRLIQDYNIQPEFKKTLQNCYHAQIFTLTQQNKAELKRTLIKKLGTIKQEEFKV